MKRREGSPNSGGRWIRIGPFTTGLEGSEAMPLAYSSQYYEGLKEDSAASAREVVPLLLRLIPTRQVIDVGCGSGTWTKVYLESGCDVLGVDGSFVRPDQLVFQVDRFQAHDLEKPLRLGRRFDLVNCLEVAEHLSETRADGFVSDLCQMADVVVFSAAVPGQGGTHHINEQWPSYWQPKFRSNGFVPLDCIRPGIWNNPKVAWWYVQNLFVYVRETILDRHPAAVSASRPWPVDVVHPRAYMRATVPSEMSPRMLKEVARALPHFPGKILKAWGS
ncbi:MAG: methyltransferase domain-containing protein [Verrucomicrobia bacterium]|nr:methyltransferase domain-containing protein [Verrucomicrobiota bacterium]